ncbi:plant SNARE 11-like [Canna indica]|uniref:Plant SNARE 11-like n=1 Tax=Canna indica TaxID=4628 RepID=A0AAQ3KZZ9_9LILI|nr:plant SNARE 11-like [Canna indica]
MATVGAWPMQANFETDKIDYRLPDVLMSSMARWLECSMLYAVCGFATGRSNTTSQQGFGFRKTRGETARAVAPADLVWGQGRRAAGATGRAGESARRRVAETTRGRTEKSSRPGHRQSAVAVRHRKSARPQQFGDAATARVDRTTGERLRARTEILRRCGTAVTAGSLIGSGKRGAILTVAGESRLRGFNEMDLPDVSEELALIEGQINDIFRALSNGFQKLQKIKDPNRQGRQLEELTDKMRECKRLIKEFERAMKEEESRHSPDTKRILHEKKQAMIKELNSYVAMKKQHASENKRIDLFDGPGGEDVFSEGNVLMASSMTNQQLMDAGHHMMDETDEAIERSKKVVEETINVGAETSAALKAQTEQMSRIVNELDSIHFSIKKASKLVKELGRQIATDRCIMAMLFLIVIGVVAIVIVKIVHPNNKDIQDIPGLAPPANRKLL